MTLAENILFNVVEPALKRGLEEHLAFIEKQGEMRRKRFEEEFEAEYEIELAKIGLKPLRNPIEFLNK